MIDYIKRLKKVASQDDIGTSSKFSRNLDHFLKDF